LNNLTVDAVRLGRQEIAHLTAPLMPKKKCQRDSDGNDQDCEKGNKPLLHALCKGFPQ
jgi:hypothetical protein